MLALKLTLYEVITVCYNYIKLCSNYTKLAQYAEVRGNLPCRKYSNPEKIREEKRKKYTVKEGTDLVKRKVSRRR